jgi:hypothetical protein
MYSSLLRIAVVQASVRFQSSVRRRNVGSAGYGRPQTGDSVSAEIGEQDVREIVSADLSG